MQGLAWARAAGEVWAAQREARMLVVVTIGSFSLAAAGHLSGFSPELVSGSSWRLG